MSWRLVGFLVAGALAILLAPDNGDGLRYVGVPRAHAASPEARQSFDIRQCGLTTSDTTGAINTPKLIGCLDAAGRAAASRSGDPVIVEGQPGVYIINACFDVPAGVLLEGSGKGGSFTLKAYSGWDTSQVCPGNPGGGTRPSFMAQLGQPIPALPNFCRIENVTFEVNNVRGLGGIYANSIQESCGLSHVTVVHVFDTPALLIEYVPGQAQGAENWHINDFYAFSDGNPNDMPTAKLVVLNRTEGEIDTCTLNGPPTADQAPDGLEIISSTVVVSRCHFESVVNGIYAHGPGAAVTVINPDGTQTRLREVSNLVNVGADAAGVVVLNARGNFYPGGYLPGSVLINDQISGVKYSGVIGGATNFTEIPFFQDGVNNLYGPSKAQPPRNRAPGYPMH